MRKYIITWVAGLLAVGVLAWFMFQGDFLVEEWSSSDNVFEFLPSSFDQLLYFSFDSDLRATIAQIETDTENAWFQSLSESVNELLVVQSTNLENPMSLMFLVSDQPVDIAWLQQAWVIAADPTYTTQKLASNVWLYGDADAIRAYENQSDIGTIESLPWFRERADEVRTSKYNVGMFSFAQLAWPVSPLAAQFAQALRRTSVASHLWEERAFGEVVMQFTPDVVPTPTQAFVPKLFEHMPSQAVAYLEFASLIDLFGIDQQQFATVASLFFGQLGGGAYGALLSSDDYAALYDGLNDHFAISVVPTTGSLLGLGASMVLLNPDIFPLFRTLAPMWKSLIGWTSWTVQVEEYSTDSLIRYSSPHAPFSLFGQQIEIERDEATTKLTIGELPASTENLDNIEVLLYDDATIATFMLDTKQLQQAMAITEWVLPGVELGGSQYLQGGTVRGNLSALPKSDQLILSFIVE